MSEISVQRALTELKTIDSKISNGNVALRIAAVKEPDTKIDGLYDKDAFIKREKANLVSLQDLFVRKSLIKGAIYKSNSITKVTIAGKEMTVAEAIARRENLSQEKVLISNIERQIISNKAAYQRKIDTISEQVDKQFEKAVEKVTKDSLENITATIETFKKQRNPELILVITEQELKDMQDEYNAFAEEVDTVLSESNAITKISV